MNQDQDQSYDFGGYDLQGYDVQAYEEQGFDTQAYQEEAQDYNQEAAYHEEEPAMASAQARVPQAAPAYEDAAAYDDGEDDEDFPEPEAEPKKKGGSGRTMALAGVGAIAVVGALVVFDPLGLGLSDGIKEMLPAELTAMLPMGDGEAPAPEEAPADQAPPPAEDTEPAAPPPDADSKEWKEPVAMKETQPEAATPQAAKPKPAQPKPPAAKPAEAAKPKPPAAKPAAKPPQPKPAAPVAKKPAPPKPAPVAKKPAPPKPAPVKAAVPAMAGVNSASSVVRFERNSAWVAAAEMERLWAFSSKLKSGSGHLTIEGIAGSEREASDLARRRAIRVAELLKSNNVGNQFKFTVKAVTSPGDSPRVNVTYSQKL